MTNNIVSIDIFDTAIFRKVFKPTDVFKVIENLVYNNFAEKRKQAETDATLTYTYPNIYQIYEYLPEFDVQLEIDTELELCYGNIAMQNKIAAITCADQIVFISDMYLPSNILKKMLEKCGYKNPTVFVSCEEKACKATGDLFKIVEKKLKGKIIKHYGDNYVADIMGARCNFIPNTEWVPSLDKQSLNMPTVKNTFLQKYLAYYSKEQNMGRLLGYYITPVITSFVQWILNKRKNKEQSIFFCSRDMYLAYLYAKSLKAPNIHYLHASRKSLAPVIYRSSNINLYKKVNLILSKEESKKYSSLDSFNEVIKYLATQKIKNDDIIVDIGYGGTIQTLIEEALNIKLHGLYMQTNEDINPALHTEQYFTRNVISSCLIAELPFCSKEFNLLSYKDGKPVFAMLENTQRLELAELIEQTFLAQISDIDEVIGDISVFDIEQILIWIQFYPPKPLLELYNTDIFSNVTLCESAINFNREDIKKGELLSCYKRSYNKELFRRMLAEDNELKHLEYLLY